MTSTPAVGRQCKAALRGDRAHFFGKWGGGGCQIPEAVQLGVGNPINTGIKSALGRQVGWRQVTGPPMSSEALRLAAIGSERIVRLDWEQGAAVEAYLYDPEPARAAQREASYVATIKRFRNRGYGKPVAAPASAAPAAASRWEPCEHPAVEGVPDIPELLRRAHKRSADHV
jgi:hypothetical protein